MDGRTTSRFTFLSLLLWLASAYVVAAYVASSAAGTGTLRSHEQRIDRRLSLRLQHIPERSKASTVGKRALQPQEIRTSQNQQTEENAAAAKVCSYTVRIKTSCSSPRLTGDAVSMSFGDASRNEVYAARLDNPSSGTFARCSTDTFKIQGPCGRETCYLYLRRIGRDGWTPDWVRVTYSSYARDVEFHFGTPLPNAVWYGFNLCGGRRHATNE